MRPAPAPRPGDVRHTPETLEWVPGYDPAARPRAAARVRPAASGLPIAGCPAELANWYKLVQPERVGSGAAIERPTRRSALELVIGRDDRVWISPTTAYPWRCLCSIRAVAPDGRWWSGTGWLAGPRLVITAGHVVFPHEIGTWPTSLWVTPGADGSRAPFGSYPARSLRAHPTWLRQRDPRFDLGAILLAPDQAPGLYVGTLGLAFPNAELLHAILVNLAGYPADKPLHTLWYHARQILELTATHLYYDIDTMGGQSGSPVWFVHDGIPYVVGLHTTGDVTANSAIRLHEEIYPALASWIAETS